MIATATTIGLIARSAAYAWAMLTAPTRRVVSPDAELPSPTVVIPAYNEARVLEPAVEAALATASAEIIIVDDGSTDATPEIGARLAARHPRVRLIRPPQNGGKAAALNLGLNAARTEWVVCVDADTLMAPDAVRHLMAAAVEPGVVIVAGRIEVGNDRGPLGQAQMVEYAVECERRRLQARLGAITTVPGALGAVHRPSVLSVGGYPEGSLVEDTAVTLRLLERGRAVYAPRARARTEAPSTVGQWWRQRTRWSMGFLSALSSARRRGPRARLLVDELLAPLLAPWACLGVLLELPPAWSASVLALLGLTVYAESAAALSRHQARSFMNHVELLAVRVGYAWLSSIHLASVIGRAALRRPVAWNKLPRVGLS